VILAVIHAQDHALDHAVQSHAAHSLAAQNHAQLLVMLLAATKSFVSLAIC